MDKKELENLNVTNSDEATKRIFDQCSIAYCGILDNVPTAMFGAMKDDEAVTLFFVATPKVKEVPISFQRYAKQFISDVQRTYPSIPINAIVLDTYKTSIKWLIKLGFKQSINIQGNIIMRLD